MSGCSDHRRDTLPSCVGEQLVNDGVVREIHNTVHVFRLAFREALYAGNPCAVGTGVHTIDGDSTAIPAFAQCLDRSAHMPAQTAYQNPHGHTANPA